MMDHDVDMFDLAARRVLGVTLTQRRSQRHRFGGLARHRGILPEGCKRPLVLLHDFDMSDPVLRFLTIPGVSRLPLYYPFFQQPYVGYRVISDTEIQILTEGLEDWDILPSDGPIHYPERAARVQDLGLSPDDPDILILYSGIFQLRNLQQSDPLRRHLSLPIPKGGVVLPFFPPITRQESAVFSPRRS